MKGPRIPDLREMKCASQKRRIPSILYSPQHGQISGTIRAMVAEYFVDV